MQPVHHTPSSRLFTMSQRKPFLRELELSGSLPACAPRAPSGVILTLTRASLKGNHTRSLMLLSIPQPCGIWALSWKSKASIGQSETAPMSMAVSQVNKAVTGSVLVRFWFCVESGRVRRVCSLLQFCASKAIGHLLCLSRVLASLLTSRGARKPEQY